VTRSPTPKESKYIKQKDEKKHNTHHPADLLMKNEVKKQPTKISTAKMREKNSEQGETTHSSLFNMLYAPSLGGWGLSFEKPTGTSFFFLPSRVCLPATFVFLFVSFYPDSTSPL